jgi:2-polyprenyl-6-methoxyphenol hydroxylase-like FAD-dependent oxidoreductase
MVYDVVIAGGGPVGLFLACETAQSTSMGTPVSNSWRANVFALF